jgi:hypothetical protein
MCRTRLGVAGATLAALSFLGTPGTPQLALAAPAVAPGSASVAARTSTAPVPRGHRHRGTKHGRGPGPVCTVEQSANKLGSDIAARVSGLAGYASASDGAGAFGVIAAVDVPARHGNVIEHRAARAPPIG